MPAYTLMTTAIGFALSVVGGVLIGALVVGSRICERFVYPMIVAFNACPRWRSRRCS